jgi:hypothetical protein
MVGVKEEGVKLLRLRGQVSLAGGYHEVDEEHQVERRALRTALNSLE